MNFSFDMEVKIIIISFEEFCLGYPEWKCIKRSVLKNDSEVFEANINGYTVIMWA